MTLEQEARDILTACGVEDAQSFTAGDVAALANVLNERALLLKVAKFALGACDQCLSSEPIDEVCGRCRFIRAAIAKATK